MAGTFIQVPPDSTGKKVAGQDFARGAETVIRQEFALGDATGDTAIAKVTNAAPTSSDYGLVVRPIPDGTQTVAGTVTANLGTLNGAATDAKLDASVGQPVDAEATGNGSVIAILKRIRTLLSGTLVVGLNAGSNVVGKVQLRNPGDTADLGDASNPVRVDPTGTTTQPVSGTVSAVQSGAWTVTANQGGTWAVTDNGAGKTLKRAVVALTATGDVVAAVASKRITVYTFAMQSRNDGMTVQFRDGSAGSMLGLRWGLNTREGVVGSAVNPPAFLFATTAGNALRAEVSGSGTVDIEVSYWDDDGS